MQTDSWKDDQILNEFRECKNLKGVVTHLEDWYSQEGKFVCEIRVNGLLLEEDDENRFAQTSLAEIRELSVSVSSLAEIVEDVHRAFLDCIPSLQETALRASEFFRGGNFAKAQNIFAALLEGCQWLVDTLAHTRRASVRYSSKVFSDERWHEVEKEFSKNIRQILVAFEKRDYALMADILEYEITEILESWLSLLSESSIFSKNENSEAETALENGSELCQIDEEALTRSEQSERLQDPLGRQ